MPDYEPDHDDQRTASTAPLPPVSGPDSRPAPPPGSPTMAPPGPPPGGPFHRPPMPSPPPSSDAGRGRLGRGVVAGVVAAALVVGGGAGLASAAVWTNTHDQSSSSSAPSSSAAQVISSRTDDSATEGAVEQVASAALPSVVQLSVSDGQESGSGSGIILTSDGRILTNNHVAELAGDNGTIRVDFNDGSHAEARVVGTDPLTDVAVLQAEDVSGLTPATIGRSSDLDVGQSVVAVGSPFGLDATVTTGIVSALNRPVTVGTDGQGNSTTYPAIQTDAAINPGNSGGPLLNLNGEVIGINSSIRSTGGGTTEAGSIGLGFAIPIDQVLPIADQIVAGDQPTHARLGVSVPSAGQQTDSTDGAVIEKIDEGSTAAKAGLRAGDIVTRVDDLNITGSDSLIATIRSFRPGDKVTLHWTRDGEEQSAEVTLDSDG